MFITAVLCLKRIKWVPKKRPHGHLYKGKDRLVRKIDPEEITHTKNMLDIEERNMFYLRHPYLSAGEYKFVERDYVKSYQKMLTAVKERKMLKFCKTIEDRKSHTFFLQKVTKDNKWE